MGQVLTLLEVVFDPFGLPEQERDVLVRGLHEVLDHRQGLLELLDELVVLPIAPGPARAEELTMDHGHLAHQIVIEFLQLQGEPAEFPRIHNGLRHGTPLRDGTEMQWPIAKNGRSPRRQVRGIIHYYPIPMDPWSQSVARVRAAS